MKNMLLILVASVVTFLVACNSGPSGTYSDANGSVLLELKSGGKGKFTAGTAGGQQH